MDYVQVITWAHYFSRDAMLKMTKIRLELIPDPDMYVFFEKGTKPGICYISNRYNKANSKYLKSYDPKHESKHIIYLDRIIYLFMQWLNFFNQVDANG